MAKLEDYTYRIIAKDDTVNAHKSAQKGIKKTASITQRMTEKMKDHWFAVSAALVAVGASVIALSKSFLEAATTSENYRVRLNVLLGSVSKGNKLFKEMAKFASGVSFEYSEIMGAATSLAGIMKGGVDEIKAWMPMIADLAAVSGLSIQETTMQVVRMYSAGAASADLFRERGITAMLGFQAGVSYSAEETKIQMVEAWNSATSKFKGAASELSKTWDGLMSMLKDKWFQFRTMVMDAGIYDKLKDALTEINKQFGNWIKNNETLIKQEVYKVIDKTYASIKKIITLYNSLPDGVIGATGMGIVGRILTGSTPVGKAIFLYSLLNTQLDKIGLGTKRITEGSGEYSKSIQNIFDVLSGKRDWRTGLTEAEKSMRDWVAAYDRIIAATKGKEAPIEIPETKVISETSKNKEIELGEDTSEQDWMIRTWQKRMEFREAFDLREEEAKMVAIENEQEHIDSINLMWDEQYLSEGERLDLWYSEQYNKLRDSEEGKLKLYQVYMKKKAKLDQKDKRESLKWDQMTTMQKVGIAQTGFAIMSNLAMAYYKASGEQSKTAFRVYQVFAIAEAIMSTYRSAAMALANPPGPPWSLAYVALAITAGLMQVAMIARQKPGSPSTGSGSVPSASSSPVMSFTSPTVAPAEETFTETETITTPQQVIINVNGNLVDYAEFFREAGEYFEEGIEDKAITINAA